MFRAHAQQALAAVAVFVCGCGSYGEVDIGSTEEPGRGTRTPVDSDAPPQTNTPPERDTLTGDGYAGPNVADPVVPEERPPIIPESLFCGDGTRGRSEQCDSGEPNDFCAQSCRARDALVLGDVGGAKLSLKSGPFRPGGTEAALAQASPGSRIFGDGAHPIAAGDEGFAIAFIELDNAPSVRITTYRPDGDRLGVYSLGTPESFVDIANPVIAALPDGKFAVAWSAIDIDTDELGIALQLVDLQDGPLGSPVFANTTITGAQYDPDIVWTGTELVVAWTDDSGASTLTDVSYRSFSASLEPTTPQKALAASSDNEGTVTLVPFASSWAAAWRSGGASSETIFVKTPERTFSVAGVKPGPAGDHPALVELDSTHLLLAFSVTDPENTGVLDTSRLEYAIADTSGSAALTRNTFNAQVDPYASDVTLEQTDPSLTRVGDSVYLAWRSTSYAGSPLHDEAWLKVLPWDAAQATLGQAYSERPLPLSVLHRSEDQRAPKLASSPLFPEGAVLAAWVDYGEHFANSGQPELIAQLAGPASSLCFAHPQQTGPPFLTGLPVVPDGSAANPYPICTAQQLQHVADSAELQSKSFILHADLDLRGVNLALGRVARFTGSFDGNGHTITNYANVQPAKSAVGFIEELQGDGVLDGTGDGELKNLTFWNSTVQGQNNVGTAVGAVLAPGNIDSVHVIGGTVTASGSSSGGIAGQVRGSLANSSASASVVAASMAGGIAGEVFGGALVDRSQSSGFVDADTDAGGIAGKSAGAITLSSATGAVSAGTRAGGLVGSHLGAISDSYARGSVLGTRSGGLVGQSETGSSIARSYTTASLTMGTDVGAVSGYQNGATTYTSVLWNSTTQSAAQSGAGPVSNLGSPPAGVFAKTDAELKQRATYLAYSWDFIFVWAVHEGDDYAVHLTRDYDFCANVPQQDTPPFATSLGADGTAAKPYPLCSVGQMQHIASTASLWGKQFRVMGDIDLTGLNGSIGNASTYFTGVFDGNHHTLSNFTRIVPGGQFVGLFGRTSNNSGGTIRNLTIEGFDVEGDSYVGALVGYQYSGLVQNVRGVDSEVRLNGSTTSSIYAGGLIGRNYAGTIRESSFSGKVFASFYRHVGGLVGSVDAGGTLEDSASTGSVTFMDPTGNVASGYVGGLAGYVKGAVRRCSSSAVVQTNVRIVGGLLAEASTPSVVEESYATGTVHGTNYIGGLTGALSAATIRACWASGDVTGTDQRIGGLIGFGQSAAIVEDSYATGAATGKSYVGGLAGLLTGNSRVTNSQASGAATALTTYAGGLVGRLDLGSSAQGCFATGAVVSPSSGGGLVGGGTSTGTYNTVVDSYATGPVSGGTYLGGLVGSSSQLNIERSFATGNVTQTSSSRAGGLVGYLINASTVSNSYAHGNVASLGYGGGLVGQAANTASITNSYAIGSVTGSGAKGGLVGVRDATATCAGGLWNTTNNTGLLGVGSGSTAGVFGFTDAQLKQQSTYTSNGWDLTTVWMIAEGNGYAQLQ